MATRADIAMFDVYRHLDLARFVSFINVVEEDALRMKIRMRTMDN